ncbi:MAG: 3-phosphoshikimate 1-carboxyvinyltransferase [Abditibacteriota bacterium]|nr:3-phosphoshikimate 1-carboxyvinyltransferase [Abditibacteriota bacterium]
MNLHVSPAATVSGSIEVPGDKSISHRAAIFGALAQGTTRVSNFLRAGDTLGTLAILRELGATIRLPDNPAEALEIEGNGFDDLHTPQSTLDCGNSGTTTRLMMGVLAGQSFCSTLGGDASLSRRPMDRVQIPLSQMGADIRGEGERCTPPITIRGGDLHSIEYAMPVASAQVKSAILLAGLRAQGTTTIIEPAPSRDHTERMLRGFGVEVQTQNDHVSVRGGQTLYATDVSVPGDISSATFFFVAAALRPGWEVTVRGVGVNPTRTGVLDVLRAMNAEVLLSNGRESGGEALADVTIRGRTLQATEIGGALIPRLVDELPVLALLATQAQGTTLIRDAGEMRVKESDRIAVITRELSKLGARIEEQPDGMIIYGPTKLTGTIVSSPKGDHRIAMTLAIAGLIAEGETTIENADAVTSSFPNFADLLEQIRK